jgi:Transcriptional regulator/sugar kinase
MSGLLGGIDIGGTKCAVSLGRMDGDGLELIGKFTFPTPSEPEEAVRRLVHEFGVLLEHHGEDKLVAIGVSCGGPLDSASGLILSPPNLPGWDRIDIVSPFRERFGVPTAVQNDANACAYAEWKWGAGKGTRHMVFLTFGTGMGAGLILDGKLYTGANDMAGEVGHIRLAESGPVGYGKPGSFEGFCSGGGIAQLARTKAREWLAAGKPVAFCPSMAELDRITAKSVGEAARQGDELALEIYRISGEKLGYALAILIDVLNPEKIVIGSIFARQQPLLEPWVKMVIEREALSISRGVCSIVPSHFGDQVGDYAGLSVAAHALETADLPKNSRSVRQKG